MTQEQKDLLLKDLCARLPYRVVVDYAHNAFDVHKGHYVKHGSKCILNCYLLDTFISPRQNEEGEYIKPYLFPLSSMTEEQSLELEIITDDSIGFDAYSLHDFTGYSRISLSKTLEIIQWCYKNNFDINGLIPMGLANDATNLNIYRTYGKD